MQRGEGATKFRYDLPILGTALGNRQILILEKKNDCFRQDSFALLHFAVRLSFAIKRLPLFIEQFFFKGAFERWCPRIRTEHSIVLK